MILHLLNLYPIPKTIIYDNFFVWKKNFIMVRSIKRKNDFLEFEAIRLMQKNLSFFYLLSCVKSILKIARYSILSH